MSSIARSALLTLLLLASLPARAGTLTMATWRADPGFFPPVAAYGSSTSTAVDVYVDVAPYTTQYFIHANPNTVFFQFKVGGSARITAHASMAGATRGVAGEVVVKTAIHTKASMVRTGKITLLHFPLSAGRTGALVTSLTVLGQYHQLTVSFGPWTPHTQVFHSLTVSSYPLPDAVGRGSFHLGPHGTGTVTLVSPTKVILRGPLTHRTTASFTTLRLSFVPEPTSAVLLGAALAVGLGLAAARHGAGRR